MKKHIDMFTVEYRRESISIFQELADLVPWKIWQVTDNEVVALGSGSTAQAPLCPGGAMTIGRRQADEKAH